MIHGSNHEETKTCPRDLQSPISTIIGLCLSLFTPRVCISRTIISPSHKKETPPTLYCVSSIYGLWIAAPTAATSMHTAALFGAQAALAACEGRKVAIVLEETHHLHRTECLNSPAGQVDRWWDSVLGHEILPHWITLLFICWWCQPRYISESMLMKMAGVGGVD